jgi:hypothetical protein
MKCETLAPGLIAGDAKAPGQLSVSESKFGNGLDVPLIDAIVAVDIHIGPWIKVEFMLAGSLMIKIQAHGCYVVVEVVREWVCIIFGVFSYQLYHYFFILRHFYFL